jgi:CheY-like chemotaxis protein
MLVVDDEAQVRASFATLLEGDGYKVLQASNGREAQARCRETPLDVAIIDLVMPEQEGLVDALFRRPFVPDTIFNAVRRMTKR